jgi:hypothetical protein
MHCVSRLCTLACTVLLTAVCCCWLLCVQASATRALQRLNDIPDLKELLANSAARDMITESISGGSLINSSFGTAGCAAASAAGAAAALSMPGAGAASLNSGLIPAGRGSCMGAGAGDVAGGGEVDDFKQLAEVLACSSNKWLREKAAAAVEQLAADDVQACRWVYDWLPELLYRRRKGHLRGSAHTCRLVLRAAAALPVNRNGGKNLCSSIETG